MSEEIDLGSNHQLSFTQWAPDRELNPQYDGILDIPKVGAIVRHLKPDGSKCISSIIFDLPECRSLFADAQRWQVESWEPLTLSPSLFCNPAKGGCGDHGFIRNGAWVKA